MKTKWAKPTKLSALLKKHRANSAESPLPENVATEDPISVLIHSWLLWEATTEHASVAMGKLMEARVDVNEIRVSLPHELAPAIGKRYPRLEERLGGLKRSLHAIYMRRHEISLDYVREKGKRDAKAEIESLDGMNAFVSGRLLRLSFDVHAMPADEQLSLLLHELGVIDEVVDHETLATWLASAIKADDGPSAIDAIQAAVDLAWSDGTMTRLSRRRRGSKASNATTETVADDVSGEAGPDSTEKAPSKKTSSKKAPSKKTPSKKTPAKKSPGKKTPAKKAPSKKTSSKKTPSKKPSAKKAPAKKTAKKSSAKKTTTKKVVKKAAAKKAASKKAASKKAATKKTSAGKGRTKKTPANKSSTRKRGG